MVTNKKLLEELTNQSQVNNEALREQLRSYIQTVEETQKSTVLSIHEQLEEIRVQQDAMNCHNEQKMETLSQQVVSDLYQKVSKYTQSSLNQVYVEFIKRLNEAKEELEGRMEQQNAQFLRIYKSLSESMDNIQKDNAIIMETLQLILANLLIDKIEVPKNTKK